MILTRVYSILVTMADVTLRDAVFIELDQDFFTRFQFQPLNIIDSGMCGEVVLARSSEDPKRKLVVKKFSLLTKDKSERNKAMFYKEVRFMQALKHPFLTTCLLPVKCPDYLAISMHYYQRRTLDHYMGNISIEISELCVIQVACALRYMHRNNMAHLDVKLDNIFMDDEFNAILGDFGLSVELSAQQETLPRWKCGGTLGYSAPEHRRAKREDELNPYKVSATL